MRLFRVKLFIVVIGCFCGLVQAEAAGLGMTKVEANPKIINSPSDEIIVTIHWNGFPKDVTRRDEAGKANVIILPPGLSNYYNRPRLQTSTLWLNKNENSRTINFSNPSWQLVTGDGSMKKKKSFIDLVNAAKNKKGDYTVIAYFCKGWSNISEARSIITFKAKVESGQSPLDRNIAKTKSLLSNATRSKSSAPYKDVDEKVITLEDFEEFYLGEEKTGRASRLKIIDDAPQGEKAAWIKLDMTENVNKRGVMIIARPNGLPQDFQAFTFWLKGDGQGVAELRVVENAGGDGSHWYHFLSLTDKEWKKIRVGKGEFKKWGFTGGDDKLENKNIGLIELVAKNRTSSLGLDDFAVITGPPHERGYITRGELKPDRWIWLFRDGKKKSNFDTWRHPIIFQKDIYLKDKPDEAKLMITAEEYYYLIVNGKGIGDDREYKTIEEYDITSFMNKGSNKIIIIARNSFWRGGLWVKGKISVSSEIIEIDSKGWEVADGLEEASKIDNLAWEKAKSVGEYAHPRYRVAIWEQSVNPQLVKKEVVNKPAYFIHIEFPKGFPFKDQGRTNILFAPDNVDFLVKFLDLSEEKLNLSDTNLNLRIYNYWDKEVMNNRYQFKGKALTVSLSMPEEGYFRAKFSFSKGNDVIYETTIPFVYFTPVGNTEVDHTEDPFGICDFPQYPGITDKIGVSWSRGFVNFFHWAVMEPKKGKLNLEAARWDDRTIPEIIQEFKKYNINFIGYISYQPNWSYSKPNRKFWTHWTMPKDMDDYKNFVKAVINRYKKDIRFWQLSHTEPYGTWKDTIPEYVEFLKAGYEAAKEADPECKVILPAIKEHWLTRILEEGGAPYFDIVNYHMYYSYPEQRHQMIMNTKKIMSDFGIDKPILDDESGAGFQLGNPGGEKYQAESIPKQYAIDLMDGVMRSFYYRLFTSPFDVYRGLFRPDMTPLPGLISYATTVRMLRGRKSMGWLNIAEGVRVFAFEKEGDWILVCWTKSEPYDLHLPIGQNRISIIDIMGNEREKNCQNDILNLQLTTEPIFILGFKEWPFKGELSHGDWMQSTKAGMEKKVEKNRLVCLKTKQRIIADGRLDDWKEENIEPLILDKKEYIKVGAEKWEGPDDLSVKFLSSWDDENLYLAWQVTDNTWVQAYTNWQVWRGDCIQLGLDIGGEKTTFNDKNDYSIDLAMGSDNNPVAWCFVAPGLDKYENGDWRDKVYFASRKTSWGTEGYGGVSGYGMVYELAIPWNTLGNVKPHPGKVIGMSFFVIDNDDSTQMSPPVKNPNTKRLKWFDGIAPDKNPSLYGDMILK